MPAAGSPLPTPVAVSHPTAPPPSQPPPPPTATAAPPPPPPSGQLDQRQEASLPQAREELAAASLGSTLYELGGYDGAGNDTSTVLTYSGSWGLGPALPQPLDHLAAAVLDGRLYVVGGSSNGVSVATTYRLAGDHWEQLAPLNHARGALSLLALNGWLYAIGGRDSNLVSIATPEVYDPISNTWADLQPMPAPRHHMAAFVYQGMACVAGGKLPYTARVDCLDPLHQTWHQLPDLPQATSGAGAAVVGGQVIVVGGQNDSVVPQVFRFDGQAWQSESMLIARHGMQLAILGGRAWACGGGLIPGLHPVSDCTSIGPPR